MNEPEQQSEDLSGLVSEATDRVQEHGAAADRATEAGKAKPKGHVAALVAAGLAVVLAVDAFLLVRPLAAPLPFEEQTIDLSWLLVEVVQEVEAFRAAEGRLPSGTDLDGLLGELVSYTVVDGGYRVATELDGNRVEYDSIVPLEE